MKKAVILFFVILSASISAQSENFGREISLKEKTSISAILAAPENYVGKNVLVEGEILDVCAMAGCWMELKGDSGDQKIKVKVKDGDIVFPVEAKGKKAMVEGTVYKIELTEEEAVKYYEHVAQEQGTEFEEGSITGPVTLYQIKGLGAVIE